MPVHREAYEYYKDKPYSEVSLAAITARETNARVPLTAAAVVDDDDDDRDEADDEDYDDDSSDEDYDGGDDNGHEEEDDEEDDEDDDEDDEVDDDDASDDDSDSSGVHKPVAALQALAVPKSTVLPTAVPAKAVTELPGPAVNKPPMLAPLVEKSKPVTFQVPPDHQSLSTDTAKVVHKVQLSSKDLRTVKVPKQQLAALTCDELRGICQHLGVMKSGNKEDVVTRLLKKGVTYGQLEASTLRLMLKHYPLFPADEFAELDILGWEDYAWQLYQLANIQKQPTSQQLSSCSLHNCRVPMQQLKTLPQRELRALTGCSSFDKLQKKGITYGQVEASTLSLMLKPYALFPENDATNLGWGDYAWQLYQIANIERKHGSSTQEPPLAQGGKQLQSGTVFSAVPAQPILVAKLPAGPTAAGPAVSNPAPLVAKPKPSKFKVVALCVGVSDYNTSRLANAAKDAKDFAAALQNTGAQVSCLIDPDINQLKQAVDLFCFGRSENGSSSNAAIVSSDADLAVFFYAGHGGVSVGTKGTGQHFMMAKCWRSYPEGGFQRSADNHGLAVEKVIETMESKKCPRNLVILDACRAPGRGRGCTAGEGGNWNDKVVGGSGTTLVCNACNNLETAGDGVPGRNGVYTQALLKHLFKEHHEHLFDAIDEANREVLEATHKEQVPHMDVVVAKPFQQIHIFSHLHETAAQLR